MESLVLPDGWWGPPWASANQRSLADLVADGVLADTEADLLRTLVASGISLTVAASPSGAGKTTLLTALLPFVPADRTRRFTRGSFDLGRAEPVHANNLALLVNEISPHLPIYTWSDALRDVLHLGADGAQVLATAHAGTPEELVFQLATSPMRLSAAHIGALETVAFLTVGSPGSGPERRLSRVVRLRPTRAGDGLLWEELVRGGVIDGAAVQRLLADHLALPPARGASSATGEGLPWPG